MPGNPGDPHHHGGVMMDAVGPPLGAHPHGRMGAENGAVEPVDQMPMPPVQEEESAETNGRDCLKNITHVQSQEEMLSLLPDTNPAYGFKERQASLSCRFTRDRRQGSDKWRTIGHGGNRLSHVDLASAAAAARHEGDAHLEGGLAAQQQQQQPGAGVLSEDGDRKVARAHAQARRGKLKKRGAPALGLRLRRLLDGAVKSFDDAFLAVTGPMMTAFLGFMHDLPKATCQVDFEKDLRMPILDEKTGEEHSLSFLIIHPRNYLRKKYPVVLIRNPYGRLTFFYFFYTLAERGYIVIVQDVRGRGESTGVFDCITDYQDGQATLNWITSQPWYSKEHGVGLLGLSYNGFVLWSTFKEGPVHPAVKAVVPVNTTCRLTSINYRDGPLHLELVVRWSGYLWSLTRDTYSLLVLLLSLGRGLKFLGYLGVCDHPALTRAMRHLPVNEITKLATGVQLNRFSMFMSPPDCKFVTSRCNSGALRGDLPPAQIHSSWYDIFLIDSLHDYQTVVDKGNKRARILISTDSHINRYFLYGDVVKSAVAHFRRYLRANPRPYESDAERVQVQLIHAKRGLEWWGMPSWPPPSAPRTSFLTADGRLCTGPRALDGVAAGARQYVYRPTDPTPSIGGNGIGFLDSSGRPQARLEKRDGQDMLVYTSEPLQEDVVVMGRPKLVLWVRCLSAGAVQADFVGRLCDVFPSGRSINICDGVKRLHFEHAHRDPRGAFKVEVEIYPTAVRFAKGHRLRLHVASAGFCRWERNLCGYGYESLIPVRFEVLHGGLYPAEASHVELPVVRLEDLKPCTAP